MNEQASEPRSTRRVTTGHDARGRAVVVSDEMLEGDPRARVVWGADAAPALREDGGQPEWSDWWPRPGGIRVSLCQRLPEDGGQAAASRGLPHAWPDIHDGAGFHASTSVDVVVMLSGEVTLELDDGVVVRLHAGDSLIQNGTRHRWRNHGTGIATMAVIVVGAVPRAEQES